jgi:DNA-directed RNA polymerase subunit RPC12/RpoP
MAKIIGMNDGKPAPVPQPKKVTLDQTTAVVCPECEGEVFAGVKFRKVSKLLTGALQDQLSPIEVYTCGGCGEVLKELLPPELRDK